ERLRHLCKDDRLQLHAADGFRLQHVKEPAFDQRGDHGFGQFADFIVCRRCGSDHGLERPGLVDLRMSCPHLRAPAVAAIGVLSGRTSPSSWSIEAIDLRPVSKPKNRKAQPHSAIQAVKYMNEGRMASSVALGVITFDAPTISARPSGPMILPIPPKP